MAGKLFDGIARFDETFYASLARMVNEEPVQTRDLVAMAQIRSIGIEKGKPFAPDDATKKILRQAIAAAHATFMHGATEGQSFWPGSHWILPGAGVGPRTAFGYETGDRLEIDERGMLFYLGCAPPKKLGAATFYVWGVHDAGDDALRGDRTYRLHVPANVPAKQFWALTVYDLETAGFMRDSPRLEINSYQQVQKNADGSVDVLFGPSAPVGKEANWVYTAPGKPWISAFRFYGPEPSVFDKSWRLPDIERAI
jgi:hypothetical protein